MEVTKELIDFLYDSIYGFGDRTQYAIDEGYRLHLSPSQVDDSLNDEICDSLEEYAEENGISQEEVDSFIIENIDDIYFNS